MSRLNFSWIIDGKLAGHQAPTSEGDLIWLKEHGILSLVRMTEENKSRVDTVQMGREGLLDCHEPVADFAAPKQTQIDKMISFIANHFLSQDP